MRYKGGMTLTQADLDKLTAEVLSPTGPSETTKTVNAAVIAAFRANNGKVPGELEGARFLLLTHRGAKSGKERTTPLAYVRTEGRILIVASMGGAPTSPAWFHNIVAKPDVTVEAHGERYPASAVVLEGEERNRLFAVCCRKVPPFATYQQRTERVIPLIELVRS